MSKHTPTPWWPDGDLPPIQIHGGMDGDAGDDGRTIINCTVVLEFLGDDPARDEANAAFIVRACNAYGAIKKLCAELDQTADVDDGIPNEAMRVLTTIRHFLPQ